MTYENRLGIPTHRDAVSQGTLLAIKNMINSVPHDGAVISDNITASRNLVSEGLRAHIHYFQTKDTLSARQWNRAD